VKTIEQFVVAHSAWAVRKFPDQTTEGICKHIEKELIEVRACNGKDLVEWIDVIMLALDGYGRNGGTPEALLPLLDFKLNKNIDRVWAVQTDPNQPVEHIE